MTLANKSTISVFEHDTLWVGKHYGGVLFSEEHFTALDRYFNQTPNCVYFTPLNKRIKFHQFVGALQVGRLTIQVLPKTDRSAGDLETWQSVLIQLLVISRDVEARTTTHTNINLRKCSVLESYVHLFLDEVNRLVHEGLVKKYRTVTENQTALKGKIDIAKQISRNNVHAERFYVSHTVYSPDNVFNSILLKALWAVQQLRISVDVHNRCEALLLYFANVRPLRAANDAVFKRLTYDRKTESYRNAIEIARLILLNFHPDVRGGSKNVLAIMVDMNRLWENYIYWSLRKQLPKEPSMKVLKHHSRYFWQSPDKKSLRLSPDIVLQKGDLIIILDTKWKYQSSTSIQDIRQMYAYGHYFDAQRSYLVFPGLSNPESVYRLEGFFYDTSDQKSLDEESCGHLFINLFKDGKLNLLLGKDMLDAVFSSRQAPK